MQTVKLGLTGFEQDLPSENRVNEGVSYIEKSSEGEAANGTIRKDFVSVKRVFRFSYSTVTEANKELLEAIYNLQITNATTLNLILSKQDTSTVSYTVYMEPLTFGAVVIKDIYYHNGVQITLREATV